MKPASDVCEPDQRLLGPGDLAGMECLYPKSSTMSWSFKQWGALGALALVLSGCSSAGGQCAGFRTQMPATAVAGTTLTVHLWGLYATCPDTGQGGSPEPYDAVTVDAVWAADPDRVVVSASAAVSDQAAADVGLQLPPGGSGLLLVKLERLTVGQMTTPYHYTVGQVSVSPG